MIATKEQSGLIEMARDRILKTVAPLRIILFGSRARGCAAEDSDLDLLVVLATVQDKRHTAIEIRRALVDLPVGKDVLVATPDELTRSTRIRGSILSAALDEGRIIFERT